MEELYTTRWKCKKCGIEEVTLGENKPEVPEINTKDHECEWSDVTEKGKVIALGSYPVYVEFSDEPISEKEEKKILEKEREKRIKRLKSGRSLIED